MRSLTLYGEPCSMKKWRNVPLIILSADTIIKIVLWKEHVWGPKIKKKKKKKNKLFCHSNNLMSDY